MTGHRPCDVTNRPTDFVAQNVGSLNKVARLPKTRWLPNGNPQHPPLLGSSCPQRNDKEAKLEFYNVHTMLRNVQTSMSFFDNNNMLRNCVKRQYATKIV